MRVKSRRLPALPLRVEIFVASASLILLVAIIAGAGTLCALNRFSSAAAEDEIQNAANSVAHMIERSLVERRHEMEMTAAALELREAVRAPAAARTYLRRVQEMTHRSAMLGFINSDGIMLVTSNGLAEGADVSNRSYFRNGRSGMYVGDAHDAVLLASALGEPDRVPRFVDIAAPVRDDKGLAGVAVAHLSTEWAEDVGMAVFRRSFARYHTLEIEIRAADGNIIFTRSNLRPTSAHVITKTALVSGIGSSGHLSWPVRISAVAPIGLPGQSLTILQILMSFGAAIAVTLPLACHLAYRLARPVELVSQDLVAGRATPPWLLTTRACQEVIDMRSAIQLDSPAPLHRPGNT